MLQLDSKWYNGNLQLACWSQSSRKRLKKAFFSFREIVLKKAGAYCIHLKGRGGIKGSTRLIHRKLHEYPFVVRLDIISYYASIDHKVLFRRGE